METTTITHETTLNNWGLSESLALLRTKLFHKAKTEPSFKFYSLFSQITRKDTFEGAWKRVRAKKGSPGIDGVSFEDIEKQEGGVAGFLESLRKEIAEKTYKPQPVKRVYIPKAGGGKRPLGIPTVKDRVAQQAVLLIIEPIFEADFLESSFGFRPNRSAHDAIEKVQAHLKSGKRVVYDADLKGYFDTIPHDNLIKAIRRRIVDGSVIRLVKLWLTSVIAEEDDRGKTRMRRSKSGTPQGGVISPLLANIYLHFFEKYFESFTDKGRRIKASIVRYADDFVILMTEHIPALIARMEEMLEGRFRLTINREKTKLVDLREMGNTLDFLGYSFRYERSIRYEYPCLSITASKQSVKRVKEKVGGILDYRNSFKPLNVVIVELNRLLTGWGNYYSLGYRKKAYTAVNHHVGYKFWKFCTRKSQRKMKLPGNTTTWHDFAKVNGLVFLKYGSV